MKILFHKLFLVSVFISIAIQGFSQGLIIIQSDETGTGSLIIDSAVINHQAEVNRYIPSGNWHIISSPVGNQQLGQFVSTTANSIVYNNTAADFDLAPYNEVENAWNPYTNASDINEFEIAKAYSARRSSVGEFLFSGIVNVGDFTIPVTNSTDSYGWNGIGNPYTSSIFTSGEFGFFEENSTVFDNSFRALYIWDQSKNDYSVILETNETLIPETKDTITFEGFALGQGFIIKARKDTLVTFKRSMQTHGEEIDIPFKSGELPWSLIKLNVNTGRYTGATHFAFNSAITTGLNPGYDVGKFKGNPELAIYSKLIDEKSDVDFLVQALPDYNFEEYRIPIGLDFPGSGIINFTAETLNLPVGMEVYIEDTKENSFAKLDAENAIYVANIENGSSGIGRFFLLTSNTLVVSSESELKQNEPGAFINNGRIYLNGDLNRNAKVSVYSVDGKIWFSNSLNNMSERSIDSSSYPVGVYLLHIKQNNSRKTIRLINPGTKL